MPAEPDTSIPIYTEWRNSEEGGAAVDEAAQELGEKLLRMSAERWGALPLGELHPEDRCALCGVKGAEAGFDSHPHALRRTVLAMTQATALVCVDVIACERRRYRAKNP